MPKLFINYYLNYSMLYVVYKWNYKLLSASIGFNLLAFLAGIYPNTIPTAAENPTANEMVDIDTTKPIPMSVAATYAMRLPSNNPISPPMMERNIDSIIN